MPKFIGLVPFAYIRTACQPPLGEKVRSAFSYKDASIHSRPERPQPTASQRASATALPGAPARELPQRSAARPRAQRLRSGRRPGRVPSRCGLPNPAGPRPPPPARSPRGSAAAPRGTERPERLARGPLTSSSPCQLSSRRLSAPAPPLGPGRAQHLHAGRGAPRAAGRGRPGSAWPGRPRGGRTVSGHCRGLYGPPGGGSGGDATGGSGSAAGCAARRRPQKVLTLNLGPPPAAEAGPAPPPRPRPRPGPAAAAAPANGGRRRRSRSPRPRPRPPPGRGAAERPAPGCLAHLLPPSPFFFSFYNLFLFHNKTPLARYLSARPSGGQKCGRTCPASAESGGDGPDSCVGKSVRV